MEVESDREEEATGNVQSQEKSREDKKNPVPAGSVDNKKLPESSGDTKNLPESRPESTPKKVANSSKPLHLAKKEVGAKQEEESDDTKVIPALTLEEFQQKQKEEEQEAKKRISSREPKIKGKCFLISLRQF